MIAKLNAEIIERAQRVELVVLDVDGVLTDGELEYCEGCEPPKRFHAHDGLGIRMLLETGVQVAVVTARASRALERRVKDLEIPFFRQSVRDKLAVVEALAAELGLGLSEICVAGDDVVDVPAMRAVGFAVSVADAHAAAKNAAHYVTARGGGKGAVRELADLILDARFGLEAAYERYLGSERQRAGTVPGGTLEFGVVIPARYGSQRLPGKPLLDLAGKPMIVRVLENAKRAGAAFVIVATDDERIVKVVEQAGGTAVMTSPDHQSGTDRIAEVVTTKGIAPETIIVNVQGDEPLLEPALIRTVARAIVERPTAEVATIATPIRDVASVFDPSIVKVVINHVGFAVTFSRAPVPWVRELFDPHKLPAELPKWPTFLRHVGVYAYRAMTLEKVTDQAPVQVEQAESLEQLRMAWLGVQIHVTLVDEVRSVGVDTAADLERVKKLCALQDMRVPADRPSAMRLVV